MKSLPRKSASMGDTPLSRSFPRRIQIVGIGGGGVRTCLTHLAHDSTILFWLGSVQLSSPAGTTGSTMLDGRSGPAWIVVTLPSACRCSGVGQMPCAWLLALTAMRRR